MRAGMIAAAALLLLCGAARAVEIVPVANASLMGGQYFFHSDKSSLGANAAALVAPMIVKSDQWSFIPLLSSNYQGTKGINDSVAAGTLFQQAMDARFSFTAIDAVPDSTWRLKPSASYKRQFLKETTDESWGHGLFDYDKIGLGFEAEDVYRDPFSYRLGFDVFRIRYMNYQSLESHSGTDPLGNPLGRENAGTNVLDSYNFQLSASATRPYPYDEPKYSLSAGYSVLFQHYGNDHVVDGRGQYQSGTRRDFLQTVSGAVGRPQRVTVMGAACRLNSSLGMSLAYNSSNQNTFDAGQTQYVGNAYSYVQLSVGPSATLAWGAEKRPSSLGASFRVLHTQYLGRMAQNADGLYQGFKQRQNQYQLGLNYAYPITASMYLKAQSNLLWVRSNNVFEKTYAYNYTASNFLLGVSWEY